MRVPNIIALLFTLVVIAGVTAIWFGPLGPASPYRRFNEKDALYYSELAKACDLLLQQHPIPATNGWPASESHFSHGPIWGDANDVLWEAVSISKNDPSLPKAIGNLHPTTIDIWPKRIWIGFGVRPTWAIIWEQNQMQTNSWVMSSNGEGLEKQVFTKKR